MSERAAAAVAQSLVEERLYLRSGVERESVFDWIEELARERAAYRSARMAFEEVASGEANLAGHRMAAEFAGVAYELGVHVGLRLRGGPAEV